MNAVASLAADHELLSKLCDALSGYAERLETDAQCGPADLLSFSVILEGVADIGHHFKEEELVVPELVRHGVSWLGDSLSRMRQEHEQSRYLVEVLAQAARQDESWSHEDRRQVIATIRVFVELERSHISFENKHLLPAVAERLTQDELAALAQRFDASDERFGRENYTQLARLAEELIARYGRTR